MASAVQPSALVKFMTGAIDLSSNVVRAVGLDTAVYTYNAAHDAYDDLTGVVATETGALASKTTGVVATGVFDAANATITAATGNSIEAVFVFVDSGTASTDWLLSYNELGSAITPNGGDITLTWHESGIFAI